MGKLTEKRVKALARAGQKGRHGDGHGLVLQVINPGNVSWLFRYERGGREKLLGLGPLHTTTLSEARDLALAHRKQLRDGIDPVDARQEERTKQALQASRTVTFADAARRYHEHHSGKWNSQKHASQFLTSLETHIFPAIGDIPVADIDTPLVLKALEPIWKTIPETASRLRGRVERILSFATVRGYRTGENPARWRGHLSEMLATRKAGKAKSHAALPYAAMPAFMANLATRDGMPARGLEFLILTAARTSEVTDAKWREVDLPARVWTIPAARMKSRRPHRVPLSDQAMALLEALPREGDYVFIGKRRGTSINHDALLRLVRRVGRADFTVHGCRSSFRDWAAERTTYSHEVAEKALAHAVGNETVQSYLRTDQLAQRALLMADWARFLYAPPAKGDSEPIPFRARVAR